MLEFFWYILIYSLEGFVVSNTSTENFLKDIKFYSFFEEFNFVILTNHIKKQRDWWLSKELFMKKKNEKRNTINDYRHVLSCLLFLLGRTILTQKITSKSIVALSALRHKQDNCITTPLSKITNRVIILCIPKFESKPFATSVKRSKQFYRVNNSKKKKKNQSSNNIKSQFGVSIKS